MLWLALSFPSLPLEVFQSALSPDQASDKTPFIIEENINKRRVVSFCNQAARDKGIEPGINATTAQSLSDVLIIKQRQLHLEKKHIENLALWSYQFSPCIKLTERNQLFVEISSCLKLFKGLDNFIRQYFSRLNQKPYQYQMALATNVFLASMAVQRKVTEQVLASDLNKVSSDIAGLNCEIVDETMLSQYSIRYLECDQKVHDSISKVGFKSVQELIDVPGSELAKRFGYDFLNELKALQGKSLKPINYYKPPDKFHDEIHFMDALSQSEQILFPLKISIKNLSVYLQRKQMAIKSFEIQLYGRTKKSQTIQVNFAQAKTQFKVLMSLTRLNLEALVLSEPVLSLTIRSKVMLELKLGEQDLFSKNSFKTGVQSNHDLVEKIALKLGEQSVVRLSLDDDYRPESAYSTETVFATAEGSKKKNIDKRRKDSHSMLLASTYPFPSRPLWLLEVPRELRVSHCQPYYFGELILYGDAERIETGWWDNKMIKRDYFVAEHPKGELYWVYQDHFNEGRWFMHGVFA